MEKNCRVQRVNLCFNFIFIDLLTVYFRYDHLSRVLGKILDERPDNVVDIFEDVSKDAKRTKFTSDVDTVQDKVDRSTEVALAQVQRKLFTVKSSPYLIRCFNVSNLLFIKFYVSDMIFTYSIKICI